MSLKKVLFVIHESKKSGAPLLLLNLLDTLLSLKGIKPSFLIKRTGELDDEFSNYGDTYFFYPKYLTQLNFKYKVFRKILPKTRSILKHQSSLYATLEDARFDVIYFNSLGCQQMFPFLNSYPAKKITHVHELQSVINGMDSNITHSMLNSSDFLISSQRVVTNMLIEKYNVSKAKIIENSVFLFPNRKIAIDQINRTMLKTQSSIFTIGGCGVIEKRKGTDIFIKFAIRAIEECPEIPFEFVWIGNKNTVLGKDLENEISEKGLDNRIKLVGSTPTPEHYFKKLDVFFLSSREEAFGLVGLENAYCENPLITFDIEGDLPKFIEKYDAGYVIPMNDFNAFISYLKWLFKNSDLSQKMGKRGKLAVLSDFKIEEQAGIIYNKIMSI